MQTTTPDLAPATAETARIVAAVRDDQLTEPTPCTGTTVGAMLDHLLGLTTAFRMAAGKVRPEGGPSADAAKLAEDWRTRLPEQLDALARAWHAPEAWDGITEAGGVQMPASAMGVVALNEVLVHGWDVAVATGQEYRHDRASVQACREMVGDRTDAIDEPEGLFGPVVPVPDDAPPFDRLLGQTGRDPGWSPR
jgi:uncharacterized protein (TIGR03086 family)